MSITHPRLTGDRLWQASALWCQGLSTTEIAERMGVSEATVANSLPTLREPERRTPPEGHSDGAQVADSRGNAEHD